MEKTVQKRQATKLETASMLLVMVLLFSLGTKLSINYVPLIVLVAVYACFIAWRCGNSWAEIEAAVSKKIGHATPIFAIFLAVGVLMGALTFCGSIPMLIYYGLDLFSAHWLYLCAFLLGSVFSLLTGTSHGSIGTVGMAMVSLGQVIPGTNMPMLAGAVVCGAIVGDKISPFSDTTLMAALVTGNNVYDHVAHQAKTVVPAAVISIIIYVLMGILTPVSDSVNSEAALVLQEALDQVYNWNLLLVLPVIVVVWGAVTRKPTLVTLLGASLVAVVLGVFIQGFSIADGFSSLYSGFSLKMVPGLTTEGMPAAIETICNRGGMTAFTKTFFVAFICYFFAASAELAGALQVMVDMLSKFIKNSFTLVLSTGISMVVMNCLCGSSTPSASVIGPLLKPKYEEMGLHSLNLAREIEDFGTGSTAFIPWSSSGVLYTSIVGVSNLAYFKYSFFIWLVWIIALFYSATGICMMKLEDGPETL